MFLITRTQRATVRYKARKIGDSKLKPRVAPIRTMVAINKEAKPTAAIEDICLVGFIYLKGVR